MPTTLIVGATRGLGAALALAYAHAGHTVYATARASSPPTSPAHASITWIPSIDIGTESAGRALASALPASVVLDIVVICAGYFVTESFDEAGGVKFAEEVQMYKTCAVGPACVVHALVSAGKITTSVAGAPGGKIILISSEAGSIVLRHASEGGGNYAHHASKAALNMVGKLLSLDLRERGVAVGVVHPGFMRTDMTKNVGYDAYWDSGGAVDPATAAASLLAFVDSHVTMERSGEFWAVRGIRDIGTFEPVMRDMGDDLPTDKDAPVRLPW
ncbi:oxidoreductase [Mycena sanguinolenta]|nr:oxidoreductase [Mycena sanguinolenta]